MFRLEQKLIILESNRENADMVKEPHECEDRQKKDFNVLVEDGAVRESGSIFFYANSSFKNLAV